MTWQIGLFLNIIFGTLRAYTDKALVEKISPFLAFFYGVLYEGVFLVLYYLFRSQGLPPVFPEMMILGALYGIGIGAYYEAIKINLSQSTIFGTYYLLISIALAAVVMGEWTLFNPLLWSGQKTILGLVLAFVSMWFLLHQASKKEEKMEKKWTFFISLNVLINGIGTFWSKLFLTSHSPEDTLYSMMIGGLVMLFFINIFLKNSFRISFKNHKLAALDGLVMLMAVLSYFLMVQKGPLTLVLPVQTLLITITIVLGGLLLFKEAQNLSRQKIIGMALGFIGVMLLMFQ